MKEVIIIRFLQNNIIVFTYSKSICYIVTTCLKRSADFISEDLNFKTVKLPKTRIRENRVYKFESVKLSS